MSRSAVEAIEEGARTMEADVSDAPLLQVAQEHEAGGVVLRLRGDLDAATTAQLEAQLAPLVAGTDPAVVLDMAHVRFVDSAGLRTILRAQRNLQDAGRRLVLRTPGPMLRRLLAVTGLEGHLEVQP